jgi:hypothetical protein
VRILYVFLVVRLLRVAGGGSRPSDFKLTHLPAMGLDAAPAFAHSSLQAKPRGGSDMSSEQAIDLVIRGARPGLAPASTAGKG